MKQIINIGVSDTNSFEVNKHARIINTFAFFGGVFSLSFCVAGILFANFIYATTCFVAALLMGIVISCNKFGKYSLAKTFLLIIIPIIVISFFMLFGSIGIEYYLFSEIVFLFFLYKKTWSRVAMFVFLVVSFFTIEIINQHGFDHPSSPVFEYVFYTNISVSFFLTFVGLNLFYQEHIKNQKIIEEHNQSLLVKNREIQNQNIVKNKLFSLVSHDLKGPLRSLNTLIDMLGKKYITAEQLREQLPGLSEKLNNTTNLVENLLAWTKTQLKGIQVNPQEIELVEVINEIIGLFEENLLRKSIMLDVNFKGTGTVVTDKEMIRTILRNIFHNAIKYSNPGGKIYISLENPENNCLIKIKDEGTGMEPSLVDKFNNNEELLSVEGTSGEKGTGLGLLIVKELGTEIKSSISIESVIEKGTVFTIELPFKI